MIRSRVKKRTGNGSSGHLAFIVRATLPGGGESALGEAAEREGCGVRNGEAAEREGCGMRNGETYDPSLRGLVLGG